MKIVSWNCAMGFRDHFECVRKYDADIYVIAEAENPSKYKDNPEYEEYINFCSHPLWIGDDEDKGLMIFAKESIDIIDNSWNSKNKLFLSVRVDDSFNLVGVWSQGTVQEYVKNVEGYLKDYKNKLKSSDTLIMCGDFNINPKVMGQEKKDGFYNKLNDYGFESVYHKLHNEKLGKESIPTHFHQYDKNKPFHIDYVFSKRGLVKTLEIGTYEEYVASEQRCSDHVPLIFEVDI